MHVRRIIYLNTMDLLWRTSLIHVLEEYADVFASNPKKPNTTHLMEHVTDIGDYLR